MVPQVRVPGFWTVPGRRAEALSLGIVATVEHAGISRPWAVLSEVTDSNGERAHLPMLDLRCEHSAANLLSVQRIAEHLLECPWVIIQSPRSYHIVGATLFAEAELTAFYGKSILCGPIVDRHYVAHQLINGIAGLRIHGESELCARLSTMSRDAWG